MVIRKWHKWLQKVENVNLNKYMLIKNILVTNDDGTTQNFVPEVTIVPIRKVSVPLGVGIVLEAEV